MSWPSSYICHCQSAWNSCVLLIRELLRLQSQEFPLFPLMLQKLCQIVFFFSFLFVNYSFLLSCLFPRHRHLIKNYLSLMTFPVVATYLVTYSYSLKSSMSVYSAVPCAALWPRCWFSGVLNLPCRDLPCLVVCAQDQALLSLERKIKSNLQILYLQVLSIYWICTLAHESWRNGPRRANLSARNISQLEMNDNNKCQVVKKNKKKTVSILCQRKGQQRFCWSFKPLSDKK